MNKADQNYPKAVFLFFITMLIFASQDGISKYLAGQYNAMSIVMIRYWAFAIFVLFWYPGKKASNLPLKLICCFCNWRGILLGAQVILAAYQFAELGLVNTHVGFASYPVFVT